MRFFRGMTTVFFMAGLLCMVGASGCTPPATCSGSDCQKKNERVLKLMIGNSDENGGLSLDSGVATIPGYRNEKISLRALAYWVPAEGANVDEMDNDDLGPAKNVTIKWFVKSGAEQYIQMADSTGVTTTDGTGFAIMDFTVAEDSPASTFQVVAQYDEELFITYTIRVKELEKHLTIEGDTARTLGLGRSDLIRAFVLNQSNGPVPGEKVVFTIIDGNSKINDTRMGLGEEPIGISDDDEASSLSIGTALKVEYTATTNDQGVAEAYFFSGIVAGEHQIKVTTDNVETKDNHYIKYVVSNTVNGTCSSNSDCSYSDVCLDNGKCGSAPVTCNPHEHIYVDDDDSGEWDSEADITCSAGSVCTNDNGKHVCGEVSCSSDDDCNYADGSKVACDTLSESECSVGSYCTKDQSCVGQICYQKEGICITKKKCTQNPDCPVAYKCYKEGGYCIPWGLDIEPLKVHGTWYSKYTFNVSDILGPFDVLGDVISFLRIITSGEGLADKIINMIKPDNAFAEFLVSITASVAQTVIAQAINNVVEANKVEWVLTIINVLDNSFGTFKKMDTSGTLIINQLKQTINRNGDTVKRWSTSLYGTETWEHVFIYMPSMPNCKNGTASKNWPECGKIDINIDSQELAEATSWTTSDFHIAAYTKSFNGKYVFANDTDNNGASVLFEDREIEMEIRALWNTILDLVAQTASAVTTNKGHTYQKFTDLICKKSSNATTSGNVCSDDSLGGFACGALGNGVATLVSKGKLASFSATIGKATTSICSIAADTAIKELEKFLNGKDSDINIVGLDATGDVIEDSKSPGRAATIGLSGSKTTLDGAFEGKTKNLNQPISGKWAASRYKTDIDAINSADK